MEVIKAIVKHIDEPDPLYSINFGIDFSFASILFINFSRLIEIGNEYLHNKAEFDRKALAMVKKNSPRRE